MDRILPISGLNLLFVYALQQSPRPRGSPLFVKFPSRLAAGTLILCTVVGVAHGKTDTSAAARSTNKSPDTAAIVAARDAFQKGRLPELDRLVAKTQGQLLAAWPDYWRLKLALGIPSNDAKAIKNQVEAFVARHPNHPLKETAQRDWIAALVTKNLWPDAAEALKSLPETVTGPQIACARARLNNAERIEAGNSQSGESKLAALAVGQETGDACIGLIDLLAKHQQITPGYLRQRVRWSAQAGSDASHQKILEIFRQYSKAHDMGARGADPIKTETLLGQILKHARNDGAASLAAYKRHRKELTHDQEHYAAFAVGAALWRRSHAEAWPLMQEGWPSLTLQPDDALQAAARESIRQGAWSRLMETIAAMREPMQSEPTWQYWKAIALRETNQRHQAETILKTLQDDFSFYGVLARELTGGTMRLPSSARISLSNADRQKLDKDLGMQRSYALVRAGLRGEAVMEWSAAMRGRGDADLIRAALHAKEAGLYDRMIAAADRTQQEHDFSLRYPTPFKEAILSAAKEKSLDPWWVLGLIRQESRFIADVKSPVGAAGLMQIMPATGKMLAKNIGLKNTRNLSLTDVDLNVKLGTTYMRQLHDRFNGSALLASAAYNAGPSRAVSWRSALPKKVDGDAFAESIPFPETRDYVKRVLTNAVLYHATHNGGSVPSLKQLLGEVLPGEPS